MADRYRSILLFGAPGVGKGTQGKRLGERDGFVHLATGDMFRALDKTSPLGKEVIGYSSRGELVPDELTVRLWREYVDLLMAEDDYEPASDVLILDGIPRSLAQAEMLDESIDPLMILHLTAPSLEVIVQRLKARASKEGRADDADENIIRRRLEIYEGDTAPVLGHYAPSLVRNIDAIGSMEVVEERIRCAVEGITCQ